MQVWSNTLNVCKPMQAFPLKNIGNAYFEQHINLTFCSAPMARPKSGRAPTRAKEQFPSARGMVPKY